jgi:hypothetical protein
LCTRYETVTNEDVDKAKRHHRPATSSSQEVVDDNNDTTNEEEVLLDIKMMMMMGGEAPTKNPNGIMAAEEHTNVIPHIPNYWAPAVDSSSSKLFYARAPRSSLRVKFLLCCSSCSSKHLLANTETFSATIES